MDETSRHNLGVMMQAHGAACILEAMAETFAEAAASIRGAESEACGEAEATLRKARRGMVIVAQQYNNAEQEVLDMIDK